MFSFDGSYICLEDLAEGESVVIRWPVPVFTQRLALPGPGGAPVSYEWRWEGGKLTGVVPPGTSLPFF
jgi:hypothetical protein